MWLAHVLQEIELFIVLNPMECLFFGFLIFTFTGSYLESVFKFWDWGPKCELCKDYLLYDDCVILCKKCDEHRCNEEYQNGMDKGILETLR